jgi:YbbR domain-containing protein
MPNYMENRFGRIIGFFTLRKWRNDTRFVTFSICLLIATFLWLLNALGKNYTTTISYPVKYSNPPQQVYLSNTPPSKFNLLVEAHGFTLLRLKLAIFSSLKIDLAEFIQDPGQTRIEIPSERLINQIATQMDNDISIIDISPRLIALNFDPLIKKSVPVEPQVSLNLKPQHFLTGPILATPASIELSGPSGILDTLSKLTTELLVVNEPDSHIEKTVAVIVPLNTKLSNDRVKISIPVEKFTEKTITLPVQVTNRPEKVIIKLFPPQINLSFMVGLSLYEEMNEEDFSATVDYSGISDGNATLEVVIEKHPPFIQSLKVNPASIEYLIESE